MVVKNRRIFIVEFHGFQEDNGGAALARLGDLSHNHPGLEISVVRFEGDVSSKAGANNSLGSGA
jgi:hypothetical protein